MKGGQNKRGVLTAEDTEEQKVHRMELGAAIGTLQHPYFSNTIRRKINENGHAAVSPKFAGLMKNASWKQGVKLDPRKNTRRSSLRLGFNRAEELAAVLTSAIQNPREIPTKEIDAKTGKNFRVADIDQTKDDSASETGSESGSDAEYGIEKLMKKRGGNFKKFLAQKRKVASALCAMAENEKVRQAVVNDGAVKAMKNLVTLGDEFINAKCSDALCALADLPKNRIAMADQGALGALRRLNRSSSLATRYSCTLAFGSLACEPSLQGYVYAHCVS